MWRPPPGSSCTSDISIRRAGIRAHFSMPPAKSRIAIFGCSRVWRLPTPPSAVRSLVALEGTTMGGMVRAGFDRVLPARRALRNQPAPLGGHPRGVARERCHRRLSGQCAAPQTRLVAPRIVGPVRAPASRISVEPSRMNLKSPKRCGSPPHPTTTRIKPAPLWCRERSPRASAAEADCAADRFAPALLQRVWPAGSG